MFSKKSNCYATQSDAIQGLKDFSRILTDTDNESLQRILSTVFSVRQDLIDLVNNTPPNPMKHRAGETGLSDICITACEDFLLPALAKININCQMEVHLYQPNEIPLGLPPIHAFVVTNLGGHELILDVDADPFYNDNIGVIITTQRECLYSLGSLVHKRLITNAEKIERFEFYTRQGRAYLVGKSIPHLTMRYFFLDGDSNQCPIGLSPFTTIYFSYNHIWAGEKEYDQIEIILVSQGKDVDRLLWNIYFEMLSYVEIVFGSSKSISLRFVDGTKTVIFLDSDGFPTDNNIVEYQKSDTLVEDVVKYHFRSAPSSKIILPSPF